MLSEDFPALAGFRAGSLVAGYRLEAQLGAGGMAVVFRARDERLGRPVALKILSPALAADAGFRRRFVAESQAAATVDDPHIIPVYEAGESGGVLFIAMRFVAGGDLGQVLEREGPLPPGRVAGFLSPVATALDAAHRAGLVHRDVKPANILVDARAERPDHVYLSDFGVSKGAVASVSLTEPGHFLGTPHYSAPEQVQGWAVDGRADQYALACVAFQLLTGSVPFERDQGMAVLLAHLSESPPRVSSRRPGLPTAADWVLARGMAKVPEKRYGSCREFADALRDSLGVTPYASPANIAAPDHLPIETGASRSAFTASLPTMDAGTATLPRPRNARIVYTAPDGVQGHTTEVSQEAPGAARRRQHPPGTGPERASGRHAVRETAPRRQAALMVRSAGATGRGRPFRLWVTAALALTVAAGLSALALSGGGTGSHSGSPSSLTRSPNTRPSLHAMPPILHGIATLTDPQERGVFAVAFSPNQATLAAGDYGGSTYLWNLATRKITATLTDPESNSVNVSAVAFSPDGTTLATSDSNGITYLWNLSTHTMTATLTDPASKGVLSAAFSPNGTTLATSDSNGITYLWNLSTHTMTATLTDPASKGVSSAAFSPNGTTLATSDYNGSTYLWNLATHSITATLTDPAGKGVDWLAFSPNGTTLATSDNNGNAHLWKLATRRMTATLTAPTSMAADAVAFSPDGATLAIGDDDGNTYLWKVATLKIIATLTDPGNPRQVLSVAFSPDGTTLAVGDVNGSTYLRNVLGRLPS